MDSIPPVLFVHEDALLQYQKKPVLKEILMDVQDDRELAMDAWLRDNLGRGRAGS